MPSVTFLPGGQSGWVESGKTILDAARPLGVELPASCGGKGLCGKCRVRVVEGVCAPHTGFNHPLSPAELKAGWRLACLATVESDITVTVPEAPTKTLVLTDFGATTVTPDQAISARTVSLPVPSLEDQASDMERLSRALGRSISPHSSLTMVRLLPHLLRQYDWQVTAVVQDDELLGLEPPQDFPVLGLAVDIGTTTVAGVLVDLQTGADLATASRTNPQALHGDDVVSRIEYASQGDPQVEELQRLVVHAINEIAVEAAAAAGVSVRHIYKTVVAGNTTMEHFLLGVTPEHIGVTPFVAVRREGLSVRAHHLGIEIGRGGRLYTMANISGYVGGDIVAGLQAHRVHAAAENLLYIDIGTNGEMALRARGVTYACSTAAGPAFEGARISCGMRAATGAITAVRAGAADVVVETVDNAHPRGICGTGLLDAVATFLDLGLLDETGRFVEADELPDDLPPAVRARYDTAGDAPKFVLADPPCPDCPRVTLTGQDIRELQLAKGAIEAGYRTLLQFAELDEGELDAVILAGAFGSFLRPESAQRLGLLPTGVPVEKLRFVGNAALAGARVALLNRDERHASESLAREVRYVELSGRADFQQWFMSTMLFPVSP